MGFLSRLFSGPVEDQAQIDLCLQINWDRPDEAEDLLQQVNPLANVSPMTFYVPLEREHPGWNLLDRYAEAQPRKKWRLLGRYEGRLGVHFREIAAEVKGKPGTSSLLFYENGSLADRADALAANNLSAVVAGKVRWGARTAKWERFDPEIDRYDKVLAILHQAAASIADSALVDYAGVIHLMERAKVFQRGLNRSVQGEFVLAVQWRDRVQRDGNACFDQADMQIADHFLREGVTAVWTLHSVDKLAGRPHVEALMQWVKKQPNKDGKLSDLWDALCGIWGLVSISNPTEQFKTLEEAMRHSIEPSELANAKRLRNP